MANTIIPRSWQCPNLYVDDLLPLLTDPEWRVLSYMTRQIFGWEDGRLHNRAQIGLAAMVDGCGLSVDGTRRALAGLQRYGIIIQAEQARGPVAASWSLQVDADQIDVAGLQARRDVKRTANRRRTVKAHSVLSDSTQSDLSDSTQSDLSDSTQSDLSDSTQSDLSDSTQPIYIDQNQSKPQLKPMDLDRQTDRDPQPAAAVCLSDDHAQARRDVIRAFQAGGVLLPSTADPVINSWIVAYPLPAVLWAVREAIAQRDGKRRIGSWSSYVTAILANKSAEGWPTAVVDELRRGGYALDVAQAHDVARVAVTADPAEDAAQVDPAQSGGWSAADVQADPGSALDQAWAQALAELDGRIPDVFRAALASCRLVGLNGRAVVRAHDDLAAQAVTRMGRQLEIVLGVNGVDLAPAA